MIPAQKNMRAQAGFTLVELAIVMIIIGLLIAGVLKGQALIANAQVTATVAQVKAIEAATTTFKDTYNSLPGDLGPAGVPALRLPNCTVAPCNIAGNGDGQLTAGPEIAASTAGEAHQFFVHLNAASLLTGIVPGTDVFGGNFPSAKISGTGIAAGGTTGAAALVGAIGAVLPAGGSYLTISGSPTTNVSAATTVATGLKPDQALRIDTKLDDGVPDTGEVRGAGATSANAGCGIVGAYSTTIVTNACALYIHFQS